MTVGLDDSSNLFDGGAVYVKIQLMFMKFDQHCSTVVSLFKGCSLYMSEEVWAQYCIHWASDAAKEASDRVKMNRASSSGTGTKHTTGTINFADHRLRMAKAYGDHISLIDVFVSTHTTPSATPDELECVDEKSKFTYETYMAPAGLRGVWRLISLMRRSGEKSSLKDDRKRAQECTVWVSILSFQLPLPRRQQLGHMPTTLRVEGSKP